MRGDVVGRAGCGMCVFFFFFFFFFPVFVSSFLESSFSCSFLLSFFLSFFLPRLFFFFVGVFLLFSHLMTSSQKQVDGVHRCAAGHARCGRAACGAARRAHPDAGCRRGSRQSGRRHLEVCGRVRVCAVHRAFQHRVIFLLTPPSPPPSSSSRLPADCTNYTEVGGLGSRARRRSTTPSKPRPF